MPQDIHGRPHYATNPHAEHAAHLQSQINALHQQLAQNAAMIQQLLTRPNPAPAPPAGIGQDALLQLLLQERDRSDRWQTKLMESNDPAAQIESLIALSEILPQSEKTDDDSGMLKTAVEALGSVMLAGGGGGLDFDDETTSDPAPTISHEAHGGGQQPQPDNSFAVQADPGERYTPPAFSSVDVGD